MARENGAILFQRMRCRFADNVGVEADDAGDDWMSQKWLFTFFSSPHLHN